MGPLVIVANVGANDGFFNSAHVPKENELHFNFSIRTMMAWVRDDQRTYTGTLPLEPDPRDDSQMQLFKTLLRGAVETGELETSVTSATVFGETGDFFHIPKAYIQQMIPFIPDSILRTLPDSIQLTNGSNQSFVFAGVPQLTIGTFMSTQMLLRYIPPITFDTAVGKFSFFGIALKHAFTNWIHKPLFDAAIQMRYQHSTIDNYVGKTRAHLQATTNMWSVNLHASRRFNFIEPYIGLSYEHLSSTGSYTFTLPKSVVDQIGYDISPQVAHIALSDNAVKLTLGVTGHLGPVEAFISAGISKQFILGAGLAVNIGPFSSR